MLGKERRAREECQSYPETNTKKRGGKKRVERELQLDIVRIVQYVAAVPEEGGGGGEGGVDPPKGCRKRR